MKEIPEKTQSGIIKFQRHEEPDYKGRMLRDLWTKTNDELENSHDIIQWLFPSDIPSKHHYASPVLTDEQVNTMWRDTVICESIQKSSLVYAQFLAATKPAWITPYNHNYLRITRVLRCLWNMRMGDTFFEWKDFAKTMYSIYPDAIGKTTYEFWMTAHKIK